MNELINTAVSIAGQLHFLRADWFYAFIPLALFLLLSLKRTLNNKSWQGVIDPQLLPFVLTSTGETRQRRYPLILTFIAASLCITALAGPVYKQLPQPVYREQSSLVVVLDLSQSMNATDIRPSRLERAKLELLDILKTRRTGQTALVVYAADAFVVTPLTDDNATIANLVPSLSTEMMPSQGSNLSAALSKTFSLLTQAGIISGDILIITDDIHQRDEKAIKKVTSQGHRLSIFGIGTDEGGPVPLDGGFLQDSDGAIVIPKLPSGKLQRFALEGGGLYTGIRANDSDIDKLSRLFQSSELRKNTGKNDLNADIWQEEGHWLLLPLLLLAALWSRKGWISMSIPFILGLGVSLSTLPQPVHADTVEPQRPLIDTGHLWSSPDQKAMKAFEQGKNKQAAEQFTDPGWKASALYRDGNYQAAVEILQQSSSSDALYNKANALAQLGRYEEAIKAYDEAIEKDSGNSDARYNREQVKKVLEQQQQDQQQDQQQGEPGESENEDSQQGEDGEQNGEPQDSQQQDGDQQDGQQQGEQDPESQSEQQSEQQAGNDEQQQAEDEQLKQRDAEAEKQQQEKDQQQYEQDVKDNREKDGEQEEPSSEDPIQEDQAQQEPEIENRDGDEKPAEIEINPVEASITEEEKATEQWLKRIPDDPGGLLRRKFYYQYNQAPGQSDEQQPW